MNVIRKLICLFVARQEPRCRRFVNAELFEVARELAAYADAGLIPPRRTIEWASKVTRDVVRNGQVAGMDAL